MGLLSDPENASAKWVRVLKKINTPVCVLSYIGAFVWFFMLGNREFNNETYFSENALLPGLVTNEFNAEQSAKQFYYEFQQELQDKYAESEEMPVPWLVAKMSQLHLEVYTHNFTLNYPLGSQEIFKGTNVYGILRAARASSLEALVISAPYRSLSSFSKGTTAGIALMMAFAEFARPQKYWAKDIIFLITEHEQLGMQAWLEAYHGLHSNVDTFYTSLGSFWHPDDAPPSIDFGKMMPGLKWWRNADKCLDPGELKGRSGSIQAAINLEFHSPKIKYIEVKVEGLNGQLPNLDLANLVHKLCVKASIHHSYKTSYSWIRGRGKTEEWWNGVKTMLHMVATQIDGVPNGNHGLFHRYGIEAVTLEGRDATDPAGTPPRANSLSTANFYRLGVALESIMRSLNNLLERFHQSYFFYLMAGTDRFISIGQYMPCLCLLCVGMLVKALALWVSLQEDETNKQKAMKSQNSDNKTESTPDENNEKNDSKDINDKKERESSEIVNEKESESEKKEKGEFYANEKIEQLEKRDSLNLMGIGTNYLFVHLLGYVVMNSPTILSNIGAIYFNLQTEYAVFYGIVTLSVFLVIITPFLPKLFGDKITYEEMSLVNILVLIELATVCLSVGMHNFSLGLCLAVFYTPLALFVNVVVRGKGLLRSITLFLKRTVAVALHPLSTVTLVMIVYSMVLFPEEGFLMEIQRGRDAVMQALTFAVVDSMIYNNWLFNVASSVLLPIWIIFWQILCIQVDQVL